MNRRFRTVAAVALMVSIALLAVVAFNITSRLRDAEQQASIVERLRELGGTVKYDFDLGSRPKPSSWMHDLFGDDFFGDVVQVDLRRGTVTDDDLPLLFDLPTVTWLGLYDTSITDDGLRHVGSMSQLEFLWLDGTPITNAGILHLIDLDALKELLVQGTAVTDDAMIDVAKLPSLVSLALGDTAISADGIAHLTSLDLHSLHLGVTNVTDDARNALNHFSNLEHLDLFGTQVTDAVFTPPTPWPRLRILRIGSTMISDNCIPSLAMLTSLEHLGVNDTKITDNGVATLRAQMPNCQVHK